MVGSALTHRPLEVFMASIAKAGLPVLCLFESAFTTAATLDGARLLGVAALLAPGPWALPVVVALDRSPENDPQRGPPHRTPGLLLRLLLRWCRGRKFVLARERNYGSQELARLAPQTRGRLHVVSSFRPDASLYEPPAPYAGHGRPRVERAKLR